MTTPFQMSLLYRSLRLHFTSKSYDYFKYNGHVVGDNLSAELRFNRDNSRFLYARLLKHEDPKGLLISNFIREPKSFITDIISDRGANNYKKWLDRNNALYYNMSQELEFFDTPKSLELLTPSGLPFLIERYLSDDISPETVVLVDRVIRKLETWEKIKHPLIPTNLLKLRKYIPFVDVQPEKIRKAFEKRWL